MISLELRKQVYEKYNRKCGYCGTPINFRRYEKPTWLEVDHIIPSCKGGLNTIDNLMPSCRSCNCEKNSQSLEEFRDHIEMRMKYSASLREAFGVKDKWDRLFYFEK